MKLIKTFLLTAALATSSLALAHTDKPHDKKAGPVKKEQKDWGIAGNAKAGMRTVEFRMTDNMRFTPDKIEVKQGERNACEQCFQLRIHGQFPCRGWIGWW